MTRFVSLLLLALTVWMPLAQAAGACCPMPAPKAVASVSTQAESPCGHHATSETTAEQRADGQRGMHADGHACGAAGGCSFVASAIGVADATGTTTNPDAMPPTFHPQYPLPGASRDIFHPPSHT